MAPVKYMDALTQALTEEMQRDDRVFLLGEDIRVSNLGITAGLVEEFGPERVVDTPIHENALVGVAMGAALEGMRPVVEIMFSDFALLAADQIVNQVAQWRYMTQGQYEVPLVIRMPTGGGFAYGMHHSQSTETHFFQTPGLPIAMPSTPADAKGLLKTAIRSNDPVLFLEHMLLCLQNEESEVPDGDHLVPFGEAAVRREGRDVTVVAFGAMVNQALIAAGALEERGVSVEVVDPRTIVPLDADTIFASVAKTNRLVVIEESRIRGGLGAELAAQAATGDNFFLLDAPIERVAAPNIPVPCTSQLEQAYLPDAETLIEAIDRTLAYRGSF